MSEQKNAKVNYAELIMQELVEHDLPFTHKAREKDTVFTLPLPADNLPGINVKLIVNKDGDCKLRSYLASNVPKPKQAVLLPVINALNSKYRYICLSLDRDGDLCAAYDFSVYPGLIPIPEQVLSMVFLYVDIVDKCIPGIMQALWTKEEPENKDARKTIKTNLFEEAGEDE